MLEVLQALGRIERIHELAQQLQAALAGGDTRGACRLADDLGHFPASSVRAYEARYPAGAPLAGVLAGARDRLAAGIVGELEASLQADRLAELPGHFALLSAVQRVKEGVIRYSAFLNAQTEKHLRALLASDTSRELQCPAVLGRIFEHARKTLAWTFGQVLAGEDVAEHRQIVAVSFLQVVDDAVVEFIDQAVARRYADGDPPGLYQADLLTTEVSLMCQHVAGFLAALAFVAAPGQPAGADCCAGLEAALGRLRALYLRMEAAYVRGGIAKALELDQPAGDDLVSSCVDDAFFLCKKAATRALSTHRAALFPVLLAIKDHLQHGLLAALAARVRTHTQAGHRAFCVAANNLSLAVGTLAAFVDAVAQDYHRAHAEDADMDDAIEALAHLENSLRAAAQAALTTLYAAAVRSKFAAMLGALLGDDDMAAKYMAGHAQIMAGLAAALTEESTAGLLRIMAAELCAQWTRHLLKARLTQAGAYALDRQARTVAAFYGDAAGYQVKHEQFAGLLACCRVLLADSLPEAEALLTAEMDPRLLRVRTDLG